MASLKLLHTSFLFLAAALAFLFQRAAAANSNLFREYIGAQYTGVKFTDVPINPDVEFHFILSFAIDYSTSSPPSPTDGQFNVFWDTHNLSPSDVSSIKQSNPNVKVAVSLGGDSVQGFPVCFSPSSVDSWVSNSVSTLTSIIQQYNLDGVDVNYERFQTNNETFAACIGQLLTTLKDNEVISFASIAPYDDPELQDHYQALWAGYADVIDYVNFQFYGYPLSTNVSEFLGYYDLQSSNYDGGVVLASFISDESEGLTPSNGFFDACSTLQSEGRLPGIFVWSADSSLSNGFVYEKQAQDILANALRCHVVFKECRDFEYYDSVEA